MAGAAAVAGGLIAGLVGSFEILRETISSIQQLQAQPNRTGPTPWDFIMKGDFNTAFKGYIDNLSELNRITKETQPLLGPIITGIEGISIALGNFFNLTLPSWWNTFVTGITNAVVTTWTTFTNTITSLHNAVKSLFDLKAPDWLGNLFKIPGGGQDNNPFTPTSFNTQGLEMNDSGGTVNRKSQGMLDSSAAIEQAAIMKEGVVNQIKAMVAYVTPAINQLAVTILETFKSISFESINLIAIMKDGVVNQIKAMNGFIIIPINQIGITILETFRSVAFEAIALTSIMQVGVVNQIKAMIALITTEMHTQISTTITAMVTEFGRLSIEVPLVIDELIEKIQLTFISIQALTASTITGMVLEFARLSAEVPEVMDELTEKTQMTFSLMLNNAVSTTNQIVSSMSAMVSKVTSLINELAKNWSKTMNSMISNAKSAASAITSALNKIPREIVTVHKIVTKNVKAAKGFQGVVSHPTNFTVGEGGKPEFVSVTPMSQFGGTQEVTTRVNRTERPSGSVPVSRSEGDTHIHQVFIDGQQFRSFLVREIIKNQAAFR